VAIPYLIKGKRRFKMAEDLQVEWYSGGNLYSRPKRIKVGGVWEDVFRYEKQIYEDKITKTRVIIFRCNIGDNRIVRFQIEL